jgi:hypothetical protein
MGGLYAPFMLGGLKVSSWVKRLLLRQSPVSQAVDTLHTIARVSACQIYTTFCLRAADAHKQSGNILLWLFQASTTKPS